MKLKETDKGRDWRDELKDTDMETDWREGDEEGNCQERKR